MPGGCQGVFSADCVASKGRVHQDNCRSDVQVVDPSRVIGCQGRLWENVSQDLRSLGIDLVEVESRLLPCPLREHAGASAWLEDNVVIPQVGHPCSKPGQGERGGKVLQCNLLFAANGLCGQRIRTAIESGDVLDRIGICLLVAQGQDEADLARDEAIALGPRPVCRGGTEGSFHGFVQRCAVELPVAGKLVRQGVGSGDDPEGVS